MARVFFPGCKVRAKYPEASRRLAQAVIERGYADKVAGCCRKEHQELTPDDTAVCICVNCMAMIDEDAENGSIVNVWQLIDADDAFPLPDHAGRVMAVQDCGRSYDRPEVQEAVRSLLRKMHIEVVELPDGRAESVYCGASGLKPVPGQDAGFAPWRYTEDAPRRGMFRPHSDEDIERLLAEHAAAIPTDEVACYCTACDAGLEAGGKHPANLIELVFGEPAPAEG